MSENRPLSSSSSHTTHLKLPFDLRNTKVKIEGNVLQTLLNVFPNITNLAHCGAYLSFEVKEMPKGPLPLTVAGLPFTLGDASGNGKGPMFAKGIRGNMSVCVCDDLNARDVVLTRSNFRNLASSVGGVFSRFPDVSVVEIILDAVHQFHVVLADNFDMEKVRQQLPGRIAKCWANYLQKDLCRPKQLGEVLPRLGKFLDEQTDGTCDVGIGDEVFLQNSQKRAISGIVMCKSWRLESAAPANLNSIFYEWVYTGQSETSIPMTIANESLGAAICDEAGRIIGFFHYNVETGPWQGFYACISSVEAVIRAGCQLDG